MPSTTSNGLNNASMRLSSMLPNTCPSPVRSGEALQAVVVHQALDRGRHLVEVLHAHEQLVAVGLRAHHERPSSGVYVGAARSMSSDTAAISSSVNTPSMWRYPARWRKSPISAEVGVGREAAVERQGRARRVDEIDRARHVRGSGVERATQEQPPVEQLRRTDRRAGRAIPFVCMPTTVTWSVTRSLKLRRRRRRTTPGVVDTAGAHVHGAAVVREGPRVTVDVEHERSGREHAHGLAQEIGVLLERLREHLPEAARPRSTASTSPSTRAADVDRHAVPLGSGLSEHGERGIRERRALL